MILSQADRDFITAQLQAGQKKDSIAHALLVRRALAEVEQVAQEIETRERAQQSSRDRYYYTVLAPQQKPVLVRDEGGEELYQQPQRQEYKVLVKDFEAFCRDMKLDHKQMVAVVTGKQRDHRDWINGWTGRADDVGSPFTPTTRAQPAAPQAKVQRMSPYQPSPEQITYTPSK